MFPTRLGIVAAPSPTPYILLFVAVLIIAIILLVKFPSLRLYRKARNILFYSLVAATLVLTLFQAYEAPRRTVYEYYITDNSPTYYPGRTNQFNLTCDYLSIKQASFYLVVNSVNVSFPTQPQNSVSFQFNSTALKVLFTVSDGTPLRTEDTRDILFSINENVTGFSFTVHPDTVTSTVFPAGGRYGMDYAWNGTKNCYEISQLYWVRS